MLDIIDLSVQFTGTYLFEKVNLKINSPDRFALIGANGAGKTTFLKLIVGIIAPESGKIQKQKNTSIGYLPQEINKIAGLTLFNEVKSALRITKILNDEDDITSKLKYENDPAKHQNLIIRLGELNHQKEVFNYYSIDSEIKKVLNGLGFEEKDLDRAVEEFSGGWQMRIELAKILLENHDLILLDEPTNHLDIDSLRWLINFLKNFKKALIIISHDGYFLNQITNRTLEISNRKVTIYNGKYDAYLKFKEEREIQLNAEYLSQQQKIKDTEKFIERFRYKATKAKQVQSRIKQLEKIERIEIDGAKKKLNLRFPEPERCGTVPVELISVSMNFGNLKVFTNVNLSIERGEKIAFLGPNGAGKTTLSKLIANKLKPSNGEIVIGTNTKIAYYSQQVADELNPDNNLLETLTQVSIDKTEGQLRSLLGAFLFSGDEVYKKVNVLSGGEKSRIALAKIFLTKANVIVLDEPTNHLDILSRQVLQEALLNFSGSLIIVSHDVEFIRPIADKILELSPGHIQYFYGGIDYYLSKRGENTPDNTNIVTKVSPTSQINRKEAKKLEAKKRQKLYLATKDLKKENDLIEQQISELENLVQKYENDLSKEEIYTNPAKAKKATFLYEKTKIDLEDSLSRWARLNEKLEEIEKDVKY